MRKVALFVEGLAELVFVREFLLRWYEWDSVKVGFNCYTLHASDQCKESYSWGGKDSDNYFQILNVGNDNKVLSAMLNRSEGFHTAGYTLVVGLRDMFSQDYTDKTLLKNKKRVIDPELNDRFIHGAQLAIQAKAKLIDIRLHYAIMEVEAWLLGMPSYMERLQNITDPETEIYHPAVKLAELRDAEGLTYDKHKEEIENIVGNLTKNDFLALLHSGRCQSFRTFVETLVGSDLLIEESSLTYNALI